MNIASRAASLVAGAALLGLLVPAIGAHGADANPLIGSWKFSDTTDAAGASACYSTLDFMAQMETLNSPPTSVLPAGAVKSFAVRYLTSPTVIIVVPDDATEADYNIVDQNHISFEDGWGKCTYERTN